MDHLFTADRLLKEMVHAKIRKLGYVKGSYGVTCANDAIPYPHFYITIDSTKISKEDAKKDIEKKPSIYGLVEVLIFKRHPKFKYMVK